MVGTYGFRFNLLQPINDYFQESRVAFEIDINSMEYYENIVTIALDNFFPITLAVVLFQICSLLNIYVLSNY